MRAVHIIAGLAVLTASCETAHPTYPKQLADGCYYARDKPILKIEGTRGLLLIPGEVKVFKVERGGNPFRAWATFTPGILFESDDYEGRPKAAGIEAGGAPITFPMKSGAAVPTIKMNWFVEGHVELHLGNPC